MKKLSIYVKLRARPGDKCFVENYRRGGHVERGTVREVKIIYSGERLRVSYEILLDRRSNKPRLFYPEGGPLSITVGADKLTPTT